MRAAPPRIGNLRAVRKGIHLQTPQQTWVAILNSLPAPAVAELPLAKAMGHVLHEPVCADRDLPPAPRSTMDGFAVRTVDLRTAPVTLPVLGDIAAGSASVLAVAPGTCVRIFTGANLPPGADAVVKLEDTRAAGPGHVTFEHSESEGANVRRQGEDAREGSDLVPEGRVLDAVQIGMCASVGVSRLKVLRKPRVAVVTTGGELLGPGAVVGAHQERDANGPMLSAALLAGGFAVVSAQRVSDEREAIAAKLHEALAAADAVIASGGVSVGAYDFVPAAVTAVGARTVVHGVAMKPGKPFLFAIAPAGQPIFGLPGNPLSAATGLHEFVLPALRRMAGFPEAACRPLLRARLQGAIANPTGLERHFLGTLMQTRSDMEVALVPSQSSADLAAGARADGSIIVPADVHALAASSLVGFRPWRMWS
jgi:molybdopterin molybdotransferase